MAQSGWYDPDNPIRIASMHAAAFVNFKGENEIGTAIVILPQKFVFSKISSILNLGKTICRIKAVYN